MTKIDRRSINNNNNYNNITMTNNNIFMDLIFWCLIFFFLQNAKCKWSQENANCKVIAKIATASWTGKFKHSSDTKGSSSSSWHWKSGNTKVWKCRTRRIAEALAPPVVHPLLTKQLFLLQVKALVQPPRQEEAVVVRHRHHLHLHLQRVGLYSVIGECCVRSWVSSLVSYSLPSNSSRTCTWWVESNSSYHHNIVLSPEILIPYVFYKQSLLSIFPSERKGERIRADLRNAKTYTEFVEKATELDKYVQSNTIQSLIFILLNKF